MRPRVHASPYKPVTVKPPMGGKLMSNISADSAGIFNYSVKRDWRRVLDHEARAEGYDFFRPNTSVALGNQPYPNTPNVDEPITLTYQARKPNGDLAIICGTPTKLFRYFSLSNGDYFAGDGTGDEYFLAVGANLPYFDDSPGVWILIGSGFSAQAQRWETCELDGLTILNNGVDLPVTYDVADRAVKPIYELREAGIAAVGNITISNELLLCADVQQIHQDALTKLLSLISSNAITASQTGAYGPSPFSATLIAGTVSAQQNIFNALSSVGQTIQFVSGTSSVITAFVDAKTVTVQDVTTVINPGVPFFLINPGNTDFTVSSSAAFFDATMVGRMMIWDSGAVRTITGYTDAQHVVVDSFLRVPSGTFGTNNPAAYAAYSDGSTIDRIQFRIINSAVSAARRWSSSVPGSIMANSALLKLNYPMLSFAELVGSQIEILGAGVNGGNLTATLVYLGPDNMSAILDTRAVTTVTGALVQAADATGANVGFVDLQDDGSGIIAMLDLLGNLIVYKDTAIFLGQYSGVTGAPFNFSGATVYRGSKTLYFRNTLISVTAKGQVFHLFAGRNSFYRYDLVYQQPMEVESIELCKDLFFGNVGIPDPLDPVGVFAADNPITKEIFFCFPNAVGPDKALRYDYFAGQISSTSAAYTAAAGVKRPESGLQTGTTEDWFIMGTANGTVLRYGLTNEGSASSQNITVTQAGNTLTASEAFFTPDLVLGKSIQFPDMSVLNVTAYVSATQITVGGPTTQRSATTFNVISGLWHRCGQAYDSVLASGLDCFGNSFGEKEIESWVISLADSSPNTPLLFEILGTANPNKQAVVVGSKQLNNPQVQSAVGMLFIQNFFKDRITVSGINNPCEVTGRLLNVAGVNSKAFVQR